MMVKGQANSPSSHLARQRRSLQEERHVWVFTGPDFAFSSAAMKRVKTPIALPGVVTASRDVPGGYRIDVELEADRDRVPGILVVPNRPAIRENRCAAALLLHGFTSRK